MCILSLNFQCFIHVKNQFREKVWYYPGMQSCCNTLLSNFRFNICQVVAYGRLKTKENFKLSALEVGRGRLREVVAYKRFQI